MELGNWEQVVSHIQQEIFDKPNEYFNLEKIRKAAKIDRKVSIREVVEKIFGIIPKFKSKDELLEEEFDKFMSIYPTEEDVNLRALKYFLKRTLLTKTYEKSLKQKIFRPYKRIQRLPLRNSRRLPLSTGSDSCIYQRLHQFRAVRCLTKGIYVRYTNEKKNRRLQRYFGG